MCNKILFFLLPIIFFGAVLYSQNLVPDGGFEDAWTCPETFTRDYNKRFLPKWDSPNRGTPDHFHACSTGEAGVPVNFAGNSNSKEGNAYVGIILREDFNSNSSSQDLCSREYIQTKLTTKLHRNTLYCISFYYRLSSKSDYAVDALGLHLSSSKINIKNRGYIEVSPQISNLKGRRLKNKDNWEELCGTYKAHGNEEYITIGNFFSNEETSFLNVDTTQIDSLSSYAYYYIDNVKIYPIENDFECGCPEYFLDDEDLAALNGGRKGNGKNNSNNEKNSGKINLNLYDENGNLISEKDSSSANNNSNLNNNDLTGNSELSNSDSLNLTDRYNQGVDFDNIKSGEDLDLNKAVRLSKIRFNINEASLLPESFEHLDRLIKLLTENRKVNLEISGHTDNTGTDRFNKKLSKKRAKAVYDYLTKKGIDKKRLTYMGYGNKKPLADNKTEQGRALNRRVEITIK